MDDSAVPYWVLISVLFSSQPLSSSVAMAIHRTAYELYRSGAGEGPVHGDVLVSGTVRNLKQDALLGTIGGPVFEADVETERGHGKVRFLLTRQGLELMDQQDGAVPETKKPRYLN